MMEVCEKLFDSLHGGLFHRIYGEEIHRCVCVCGRISCNWLMCVFALYKAPVFTVSRCEKSREELDNLDL